MTALRTTNQTVMISGGSRGLGLCLSEALIDAGNRVATFARHETEAVQALRDRHPEHYFFRALDATDGDEVESFLRDAIKLLGPVDALINNAAMGQDELLIHTPKEKVNEIISTNLLAPILLTRLVLKRMMLQPSRGAIINIGSICAMRGYAGLTVYSATKGGMDAFTRSLAHEVGEAGIRVNAIAPGFFESEMSSVLLPSQMETIRRRTPTGTLTTERDIVTVLDMLLDRASNVHGQVIAVDGGMTT